MPCAIMRGREPAGSLCSMRAHFRAPPPEVSEKPFCLSNRPSTNCQWLSLKFATSGGLDLEVQ